MRTVRLDRQFDAVGIPDSIDYMASSDDLRQALETATMHYINLFTPNTYEATFVYLIRQQGELTVRTDHQVLGLFPLATWETLFSDAGLTMKIEDFNGIYDPYLLGDGEYPLTIFLGQKAS
ncbi:MAG: hypothetical protein MJE63_33590 [Proteobacteria bacterium]|nr:hypothetical protein [Pseudomonadota bacterium]